MRPPRQDQVPGCHRGRRLRGARAVVKRHLHPRGGLRDALEAHGRVHLQGLGLVISYFVTVGNYDYGFYWYFYLDGKIELECKATGIVFSSGRPEGEYDLDGASPGRAVPPALVLYSAGREVPRRRARGTASAISPENPVGNAFKRVLTRLERESDNKLGRAWLVASSEKEPSELAHGLRAVPEGAPLLLADDDSSINMRVQYTTKHLWVTQYARDEIWAAGYTPNRHPGQVGLPSYAKETGRSTARTS
ncbi:hypothetical protein PR001_g26816 [Phytophthora rubi]|uniref:Amine oxidase n=1 Tax=Phytophthora rubi TaxID=129364 RepID=A0A6A3HTQ1_9STRA|nr:hypothetical protein PR001_g26816 [Phytophthora rubi]